MSAAGVPSGEVRVFPSSGEAFEHAARTLAAISAGGARPSVALSGGSTPALLYSRLAEGYRDAVPWDRLEVFFGDERAVPPEHQDSNYRLAQTTLLSRVGIPPSRVHRPAAEEEDREAAARRYEEEIRRAVPAGPAGVPQFDLIWLGLGEDGHTASLFPGSRALEETRRLVAVSESPDGRPRLTFTLPLLDAAKRIQFIVTGKRKAGIVRRILASGSGGPGPPLPAARVRPRGGTVEWLLDAEAAAELR
jgi:6-phosphogluconolactonase